MKSFRASMLYRTFIVTLCLQFICIRVAVAFDSDDQSLYTEPITGMEFVPVQGGCYIMGDHFKEGDTDEAPLHDVCVRSFWMGRYEVTQRQWMVVMKKNPSGFKRYEDYPVENVSWKAVQIYIRLLQKKSGLPFRLPTEAEWEYAARSRGKIMRYPWGDQLGINMANCSECQPTCVSCRINPLNGHSNGTVPVGSFPANTLGLYDMAGNVWEWCVDVYDYGVYQDRARQKEQHENPVSLGGPHRSHVIRGGSWYAMVYGGDVRVSNRGRLKGEQKRNFLGFRLVLPASPE